MGIDTSMGLAEKAVAISLAADSDFTEPSVVYVGGDGNLKVDGWKGGVGITFTGVKAGTVLPLLVKKVYSTANGTSATNLTRMY